MKKYKDLGEQLKELAKEDKGITIVNGRNQEEYISYKTVWHNSQYICQLLKEKGAYKGCEVVIKCKDIKNFIYAFWGCVAGGFIAVPLDVSSNEYRQEVEHKIVDYLSNPIYICDNLRTIQNGVEEERILDLQNIDYHSYQNNDDVYEGNEEDIVYIQFSSGSTGNPKGATLSKKNISVNIQSIIERMSMNREDRFLSWQPLTHCYGLIAFHILPIMLGVSHVLISTETYMQDPLIWLEKVNQYRSTRLGTIPFALRHFIDRLKCSSSLIEWDLTCIKSISIGGEQVTKELCDKFLHVMQAYKLDRDVIKPIYGLAEATTCVCVLGLEDKMETNSISRNGLEIGRKVYCGENSNENISFVNSGRPIQGVNVEIRDMENNILTDSRIGYVYIQGENVTKGYYRDEKSTQAVISEDNWLDTGDIGFKENGKLVIVGREKELIVVNGKKYSCIDIENIINKETDAVRIGQVVVCNGLDKEKKLEQAIVFIKCVLDYKDTASINKFLQTAIHIKEAVFDSMGLVIEHVIPIEDIPKTYSGKIRRRELTRYFNAGEYINVNDKLRGIELGMEKEKQNTIEITSRNQVRTIVVETLESMFQIKVTDFDLAFKSYGIVSVNIPPFIERINQIFNTNIKVSTFFSSPNVNKFADYIYSLKDESNVQKTVETIEDSISSNEEKIAIVGMSCRFPGGANSIEEYWNVLMNGVDGICDVPETRWELEKYYDEDENAPGKMYCRKGGFLDIAVDEFDARFFNISPKEAAALDPQQRLLLEMTWEAFENADIDITKYSGTNTGVYVGMATTEYTLSNLYSGDLSNIDAYSLTGTCMSTACGRIAYTFGFEGPCIAVDTACSSALTALHLACTAIKAGEMSVGVVGGINLMLSPSPNIGFSKLHATSPDGHSKAFDASANGYGRGEGCGVLVIKKLSEAIRDKDNILGVIRATAINQDGKSNGLTAPNGASQAKLIEHTLEVANLSPLDVDYIEMHGTGTKLGDPIEVGAIVDTYGKGRSMSNPVKIGSVKSNIGHLEAAAGIASIAKVLLSLKNEVIPSNLYFNTPNPFINWSESPVKVINEHTKWEKGEKVRRAGINGFGFGGSNAHIIIEEYKTPQIIETEKTGINYILKISAKSENALNNQVRRYIDAIKECADEKFVDFIYSANRGRADFEYRLSVTGQSKEQIITRLEDYLQGEEVDGTYTSFREKNIFKKERKTVFMFTGQGSQYVNMGKLLFETNSQFKEAIVKCDKLFKPLILKSIIDLMYGENVNSELVNQTVYAQPLIFSIEYALYKVWESYGVKPEIVMGHSIGEYAAAVASQIMTLEDAVKLVSIRGRLMDSAPGHGAMGTIFGNKDEVKAMIADYRDTVAIAAHNAKESCVISGASEAVDEILNAAEAKGIRVKKLKVSHGFHSQLMEPIMEDFKAIAEEVKFSTPKVRFVSALYAKEIEEDQILDAQYWTEHIRGTVDFYEAVTSISNAEDYTFLEVGSNRVLAALCKLIFGDDKVIAGTLSIKEEDAKQLSKNIAQLYVSGVNVDWNNIEFNGKKQWNRVAVPTYPFERVKYWNELLYDRQGAQIDEGECHKFIGQKIESPMMQDTVVFQSKFTGEKPYFMRDHVIFETPISPAAAHISMMLSAIREVENPLSCTLKEIEFRAPLAVNVDEERQVQVCLNKENKQQGKFSIVSRDKEDRSSKWLTHSVGKFTTSNQYLTDDEDVNVKEFESIEFTADPEDGVYGVMRNAGFKLGDSFRRIKKVFIDQDKSICFIQPLDKVPNLDMYELYPGVIDSIIQSGLNAVLEELWNKYGGKGDKGEIRTTIPYYMEKLTYNYRPSKNLWCRTSSRIQDDMLYAQITVFNEQSEEIMKIENCMAKLTNRESLLREMKSNYNNMYYHTDWIEEKLDVSKLDKESRYIIVADEREVGSLIQEELRIRNIDSKLVLQGNYFIDQDKYYLDMDNKEEWKALVEDATEDCTKNVFVYLNTAERQTLNEENNTIENLEVGSLKGLLYLTQAIDEKGLNKVSKLKLVTKGVQHINNENTRINLSQAPLWGYSKVLGLEFPEVFRGIVDIENDILVNLKSIVDEITNSQVDEVCLGKNEKRYVGRLLKHTDYVKKGYAQADNITIKPEGSYLITGGTGNVGMNYAQVLVNKGAKNLLLMCRKEPSDSVYQKIKVFEEQGVNVEFIYADVCNGESVKNALQGFDNICGVIHAAGVLKDKMLLDETWEEFEFVLNPKVYGSVNIYNALNKDNLDFFIMLSSITSVIGNMGQSNYAAANYFMNSFAEDMKAQSVNGFTCCWGPWQGGGMALANDTTAKNMKNFGITSFDNEVGSNIIDDFFEQPYTNLMIIDVDWSVYEQNIIGERKILSKILNDSVNPSSGESNKVDQSIVDELKELSREEREDFLIHKLQNVCGKIMGFEKEHPLAIDGSFKEQGADSLMIFSMRTAINKMLDIDINVSVFFNYPTIVKLANYLLDEVLVIEDVESEDTEESDKSIDDLLAEINELTADEN